MPETPFFFSSRRRHTRLVSDWSSDVCSSDLLIDVELRNAGARLQLAEIRHEIAQPERGRSEEHTSELQSLTNLVCRLLLEKKKKKKKKRTANKRKPEKDSIHIAHDNLHIRAK